MQFTTIEQIKAHASTSSSDAIDAMGAFAMCKTHSIADRAAAIRIMNGVDDPQDPLIADIDSLTDDQLVAVFADKYGEVYPGDTMSDGGPTIEQVNAEYLTHQEMGCFLIAVGKTMQKQYKGMREVLDDESPETAGLLTDGLLESGVVLDPNLSVEVNAKRMRFIIDEGCHQFRRVEVESIDPLDNEANELRLAKARENDDEDEAGWLGD